MKTRLWVLGIAACGSAPVASTPPITPAPPQSAVCSPLTSAPPKTFGKLFCAGASWKLQGYTLSGDSSGPDGKPEPHKETSTLTCSVEFPRQLKGGWSANLTCNTTARLVASFPTELIATPSGLWERGRDEDLGKLDDKARILVEPPVESQSFEQLGPEGGGNRSTEKTGDAWCFTEGSGGMGQSADWTLCVRDGDVVGARSVGNDGNVTIDGGWGILKPYEGP